MKVLDPSVVLSSSEEDTAALGAFMARYAFPGLVCLLEGDLGMGKTVLVRGFCGAAGCRRVRSPSFTLVNQYPCTGPFSVVHADLFRIGEEDVRDLDLESFLEEGAVLFVEWAERWRISGLESVWIIRFSPGEGPGNSGRRIAFSARGERAEMSLRDFLHGLEKEKNGEGIHFGD